MTYNGQDIIRFNDLYRPISEVSFLQTCNQPLTYKINKELLTGFVVTKSVAMW